MKRIALFVDGANFYYTQKKLGWSVDAAKLLDYCSEQGEITRATYYTGISTATNQHSFHAFLSHIGYSLVTKLVKTVYNPKTGAATQRADLDIDIVLDMFDTIDDYDMAILVSGDGDFHRAVRMLKAHGKEVRVLSAMGLIAAELTDAAEGYTDFDTIREKVERTFDEELIA